jgi:hypothetical protein
MYNINNASELKEAILLLEKKQAVQKQLLLKQIDLTYDSFRPVNIIKNTLKEALTSSGLSGNFLLSAIGLATGYLSKKLILGASGSLLKKVFGYLLQFGMAYLISKPPEVLKSSLSQLFGWVRSKRESNS